MALPRRAMLAVLAVADIALHARGEAVAAKDLAARHGLPPRHFETILQDLARAGLVKGQRGPKGGYHLARERRRMTVGDVVRAVGLDDQREAVPASELAGRLVATALDRGERALFEALDGVTIETLVEAAPTAVTCGDFTI